MYYITKKDSETGKKFQAIEEKIKQTRLEQKALSEKYGFEKYRPAYWSVWGGISSCADFKETPDKKVWGKGAGPNEYMPKRNSKVGAAIDKEFEDMLTISRHELNMCVGWDERFSNIGYSDNNDEYFGVSVQEKWKVKMPNDCEEVTTTKYNELFKK